MDPLLEAVMVANRLFPRAPLARRASEQAYSQWEYETGRAIFERHFGSSRLRGARLLDAACGPAGKTVWYAEAGAALVVGADLELAHLRQGTRFAAECGCAGRVRFTAADAMRLPFADRTFDGVTANDAIEHFTDPAGALGELARVTRPGGRLYITFPPYRSPYGAHLYDYVKIPWCQLLLSRPLLLRTLERAVLESERAVGGNGAEERARIRYQAARSFFEHDLNGITVERFLAVVRAEPRVRPVRVTLEPPRFGWLRPLTRLPAVREVLTALVVAELERVEG